jgi:diguanylate cyclase
MSTPEQSMTAGLAPASLPDRTPPRGSGFVKRLYWPRMVGMGLAMIMVGAALNQVGAPFWAWIMLLFSGFVWPQAAYICAMRSDSPYHAEHRNLLFDSASGGFWLVAIGFNPVPSVLMLTMLNMNNASIGGMRLLVRGWAAKLIGAFVAWPLFGGYLELSSSLYVVVASIPFMMICPVFVGVISHQLSQQLSHQKRRFEALSQRDALSGLATRGYWEIRLTEEFSRARRYGRSATLLLVDIDHFKRINDSHGHLHGDKVIRLIGGLLDAQTRAVDFVGRYGGDEFGLILPEIPLGNAVKVAQRIQSELAAVSVSEKPGSSITVSIGIAELSSQVLNSREWMNYADRALYRAKSNGRNCICVAEVDRVATTARRATGRQASRAATSV